MKTAKIAKLVCVAGLTVACVWGLTACANIKNASSSGGVAATVNGTEISEDKITAQVESVRSSMSLTDEDAWGNWLAENSYTPSSVREQIIDSYVQQELIRQGAAEKNITVESSTIDDYVQQMKDQYDDDEAWQEALSGAGLTEDEYRQNIELSLMYQDLYEQFATSDEPTEEELVENIKTYISSYDGAKRSSHILFASDDETTAQEVLDKLNAGEIDFADAATQYSTDTTSAENGGDVGWDKLTSFVTEYQTALDGLEKDQMSGLITSSYGIHIIKCTDVFTAPEEVTSSDQVPSEILEQIKTTISSSKQSEAYQTWYDEYKENADIVINDMPSGLSYDVDMSKYQSSDDSSNSSSDSSSTTSTDGTTSDTASGTTTDGSTDSSTNSATTDSSASGSTSSSTDSSATSGDTSSSSTSSGSSDAGSSSNSGSSSTSSSQSSSN